MRVHSGFDLFVVDQIVFHKIERAYLNGKPDTWAIGSTLLIRLFCVAGVAFVKWFE